MTAPFWARSADEVLGALGVTPAGLTPAEVRRRRRRFGPNRLRQAGTRSAWLVLADQFRSLIVGLLVVAAVLSFAFAQAKEALAILAVIALNTGIGFVTELRAVRSMEALRRLGQMTARVRRGGRVQEVRADVLVPGDIVVLEGGDVVTADVRLIEASRLQADESPLTGESAPVAKRVEPLPADTVLAERANLVFKGTAVTRGSGEGVVVAIGLGTELGRISTLVEEADDDRTPLERRLDRLGQRLIWLTLGVGVAVAAAGVTAGKELLLMVETGVALAVATIPEGLPVVATIALARGMWRMAHRNAVVRRLAAVETLGATNVICTDKTGTLTENAMTVVRVALAAGDVDVAPGGASPARDGTATLRDLLAAGALCNNASLSEDPAATAAGVGDPLEVALLVAAAAAGLRREALVERQPQVREESFDPELKMMATVHRDGARHLVAVKGAPESVLAACTRVRVDGEEAPLTPDARERWLDRSDQLARDGLRVLAIATRHVDAPDADPYVDLVLLGLVGLADPPRGDVAPAIAACRVAGIRVVMATGDQPTTAVAVAQAVGLVGGAEVTAVHGRELADLAALTEERRRRLLRTPVFARVTPEQKLALVELYQRDGLVVAMTGDGVNDAPALKKADIGIAMGRRGTQVAREAADVVLKDDAFGTIVVAVAEGRAIFGNIRAFVLYLLSCNLSEILAVGLAALVNAPLPITPLQILYLNLVTDVFPALALGLGEGDHDAMRRPPRDPREPLLTPRHWVAVVGYGTLITLSVLAAFVTAFLWLRMDEVRAVTVSFLALAFAQLGHVFNMRRGASAWRNEVTRNPFVWGALALCAVLLFAVVHHPSLAAVLRLEAPGAAGWGLVAVAGALPLIAGQLALRRRRATAAPAGRA